MVRKGQKGPPYHCICDQVYIGTTKHSIHTRIKEHERHCRLKQLFQSTEVFNNTSNHYVRLYREVIKTHKHQHSFNKKEKKSKTQKSLAPSTEKIQPVKGQ